MQKNLPASAMFDSLQAAEIVGTNPMQLRNFRRFGFLRDTGLRKHRYHLVDLAKLAAFEELRVHLSQEQSSEVADACASVIAQHASGAASAKTPGFAVVGKDGGVRFHVALSDGWWPKASAMLTALDLRALAAMIVEKARPFVSAARSKP